MTTMPKENRFWSVLLQTLAIAIMIFAGLIVAVLGIISTPENFVAPDMQELTDLGAIRVGLAMVLLCLIPWYRKLPLILVIAGGFYAVVAQGDPYVLSIGLTVWIIRATQRWQCVIVGCGLAAIAISVAWQTYAVRRLEASADPAEAMLIVLTLGLGIIGLVLSIALITRQRRKISEVHAEVEAAEHDREIISSQMTRQTEREFLAREVHDTLAQRLTALSLQTGRIQKSLAANDNTELSSALADTKKYSDQSLRDLRSLVTSLREQGEVEPLVPAAAPGGFDDLRALLDDAKREGITIYSQILLNNYDLAPDDLQRAVIRISQEALTNVLRHSMDNKVQLRIEGQPGQELFLEFTNRSEHQSRFHDGSGTGLLGIKERAQLVGGTVEQKTNDEHFRLQVHLPWPDEELVEG